MAMRAEGVTARVLAALALAGAIAASTLAAGCAAPGEADVDQATDEVVALEVDIKRALLAADAIGGAAIRVLVDETSGAVTLDGFVDTEAERAEAMRLAREVAGGAEVVDALEVR